MQNTGIEVFAVGHDLTQVEYLKADKGSDVKLDISGAGKYK